MNRFHCGYCQYKASSKSDLDRHEKRHLQSECLRCGGFLTEQSRYSVLGSFCAFYLCIIDVCIFSFQAPKPLRVLCSRLLDLSMWASNPPMLDIMQVRHLCVNFWFQPLPINVNAGWVWSIKILHCNWVAEVKICFFLFIFASPLRGLTICNLLILLEAGLWSNNGFSQNSVENFSLDGFEVEYFW